MTEVTLGKLREAFLIGCSDKEACFYAQIHPDTLYDYQARHPEFSEQKAGWKNYLVFRARMAIGDAIISGKNADNLDIAKWYLERKRRDEFSRSSRTGKKVHQAPKAHISELFKKIP